MIIDSLAHTTPDGKWFNTKHDAGLDKLLAQIEKYGVYKTVLSGTLQPGINEYILGLHEKNPETFYPVPAISYGAINETTLILSKYQASGIKAVKIHPRWTQTSLEDPWIDDVLSRCEMLGLAVFICTVTTGLTCFHPTAKTIGELCARHRTLKLVLLHGGYTDLLKTSEEIRRYENVMLDISATLTRFYDSSLGMDLRFLIRTFDKRIVIGTDFPEYSYDDVVRSLNYLDVTWETALERGLLGRNFASFLLSEHE